MTTLPVFDSTESAPRDNDIVQARGHVYRWNAKYKSLDNLSGAFGFNPTQFFWSPLVCNTVAMLARNEERVKLYRCADGWEYALVVKGAPDIEFGYFKTAYEAWLAGLEHYKNHRNEHPVV